MKDKDGMGGGESYADGKGGMNELKKKQYVVLKAKLKCIGLDVFQFKSINRGYYNHFWIV